MMEKSIFIKSAYIKEELDIDDDSDYEETAKWDNNFSETTIKDVFNIKSEYIDETYISPVLSNNEHEKYVNISHVKKEPQELPLNNMKNTSKYFIENDNNKNFYLRNYCNSPVKNKSCVIKSDEIYNKNDSEKKLDKRYKLKNVKIVLKKLSIPTELNSLKTPGTNINEECYNFQCKKCAKKLKTYDSLRYHERYCGKEANLCCDICPFKTKYKKQLKRHLQRHSEINNSVESIQDETHISKHHLAAFSNKYCPQCNEKYINYLKLNRTECHKCKIKLLLQCSKCDSLFVYYTSLRQHLRKKCLTELLKVEQTKCDKNLHGFIKLKKHFKNQNEDTDSFHKYSSKDPVNSLHTEKDTKKNSFVKSIQLKKCLISLYNRYCPQCDKAFKNSKRENNIKCKICETTLLYQCLKCSMKFRNYLKIYQHVRTKCQYGKNETEYSIGDKF